MAENERFTFHQADINRDRLPAERVDAIFHLACPASPVHYQVNPIKTIKTSTVGMVNMLGLAKRVKARLLQASHDFCGCITQRADRWNAHSSSRLSTGSATAGDRLGGVRPSSGAAMSERERAPMESDASEQPVLAAPEDGRTPITL